MLFSPRAGHFPKGHETGLDSQQNSFWGTAVSPQQQGHPFSVPVTPSPVPSPSQTSRAPPPALCELLPGVTTGVSRAGPRPEKSQGTLSC